MAKGNNQKLKMLYLAKIFMEETDDAHGLTLPEITQRLNGFDVNADRKTLYQEFEELRRFGLDILTDQRGHNTYYHLGCRDFELPELKLLVDAVQSSRFITDRKSHELIGKLEGLVSVHQARQLHRQVLIAGRIKTMNERIYYNVDILHEAINADAQIRFHYFQWNLNTQPVLRHGGAWYEVSPWGLTWEDENYYLVAYDAADDVIKHYRVDKMLDIAPLDKARQGGERFHGDITRYTNSLFGMFAGEESAVTLEAENDMVGILIDRFGQDIPIAKVDDAHFETRVTVTVSPQFFGWVMALGDGVRITAPTPVVRKMREAARRLSQTYLAEDRGTPH